MVLGLIVSAFLLAAPSDALRDTAITVKARAHPNARVGFELHLTDAKGIQWRKRLDVRTDARGWATLADPMRLFLGAQPRSGQAPFAWPNALGSQPATLELLAGPREIAAQHLLRRQRSPDVTQHKVRTTSVVGELFIPRNAKRVPGIIVLGGSEGGYPSDIAALLSAHGYATLASAYFGESGTDKSLVDVPIERVAAAVRYLKRQPQVDSKRIALFGVSRGGELAYLAASLLPDIGAAIGIVPSPVVEAGLRFGKGLVNEPAWTYKGKPVPYATFPEIQQFLHTGNIGPVKDALIRFDRIRGPVAIIAAADDELGLSGKLFSRALPSLHLRRRDVFVDYKGAGHLIDMPFTPTANLAQLRTPYGVLHFGGTSSGYAEADVQSWHLILQFLRSAFTRKAG